MSYIDYIVAAAPFLLLIISVIAGRVRGFAEIVISAAAVIVCMIIARQYIPEAAASVNEKFIHQRLVTYLASVIGNAVASGAESVINSLPDYLSGLLQNSGISAQMLADSADSSGISETIAPALETAVIIPALKSMLYALAFIFARVAGRIISSLTGVIVKLPVIKQINGLLGAALGGITGIILAALSVLIMNAAAGFLPETEFARAVGDSAVIQSLNEIIQSII